MQKVVGGGSTRQQPPDPLLYPTTPLTKVVVWCQLHLHVTQSLDEIIINRIGRPRQTAHREFITQLKK